MFSTLKLRIILGVYIFLILSIPLGAYFVSQYQTTFKGRAQESKTDEVKTITQPPKTQTATPSAKQVQNLSEQVLEKLGKTPTSSPTPTSGATSPQIATSFGPTLSGKVLLEGRPKDNQATRLFIGIVEGMVGQKPKFLLSFIVDVPQSGEFANLSLAGLTTGSSYSALLKGATQIATSSAFALAPTETKLNGGNPIFNLSGDLNEDNIINISDYSIVKALLGVTTGSKNWNDNADFNKDGVINSFDLAIITKNLGKVGASGAWISPIPKTATGSANLPVGSSLDGSSDGYWIWVPGF